MDWHKLITDLEARGWTQQKIAARVGTSQGHISDIRNGRRGKRIGFSVGVALVDLHASGESLALADKDAA